MSDSSYPKLNLPPIKLRAQRSGAVVSVWSEVRRCYVVLTPEEWVRRHFVGYLIGVHGVPAVRIVEEHLVDVNGQSQRADIVVVDSMGAAQLVVECKAPSVTLSKLVVEQAERYNRVLGARYVVISNGMKHCCYDTLSGEPLEDLSQIKL